MSVKEKILIVEDEKRIARFTETSLESNGYSVILAATGREALSILTAHCPDLMILDLGLPDMDGQEIIRTAREWSRIPILVVSARAQEKDKVEALDAGADDYITKPFGTGELLARIRTALRHVRMPSDSLSVANEGLFQAGGLTIDYNQRIVLAEGRNVHLTQIEYRILSLLSIYAGKVLTYDFIMKSLWGPGSGGNNQILRVHMTNIRHKIEKNPAEPQYVFTEIGVGYRMIEPDPEERTQEKLAEN